MTSEQSKEEKTSYWLKLADYDLNSARVLLNGKMYLYVGFMCHQTIEKVFKACFVKHRNEVPPYSHNLSLLAKECNLLDDLTENQKQFISMLQPMNIEARYPSYKSGILDSLDARRCEDLLKKTEEFYRWLQSK